MVGKFEKLKTEADFNREQAIQLAVWDGREFFHVTLTSKTGEEASFV